MTINIALLGFGTVASGVPFLLENNANKLKTILHDEIKISKILMRDQAMIEAAKSQGHSYHFVLDLEDILSDDSIKIVVELMGRIEPAKTYITKLLQAGKNVVTANKDLLATYGAELRQIAKENQVSLYYEAAVAGGIPILRVLANSFVSDKVTRVLGVVNGTSNFMMTKMVGEGWTYDQALAEAQQLGYAESNPTNDVDGIDAGYKLTILSEFAFGMTIGSENVLHEGIRTITPVDVEIAQQLGYVIKLIGEIVEVNSGIFAEVSPAFLPKSHPLASVNDVMNAIFVESIGIGESMFYGPGAGKKPTATSVLADIVRLAKRIENGSTGKSFNEYVRPTRFAASCDVQNNYYFSVETPDTTGQFLRLTTIFTQENISFEQVVQQKGNGKRAIVAIICHKINRLQLENVKQKLQTEVDFKLLNAFKVLGE